MEYRINKDEKVYPSISLTGGREDTPTIEIVPSNYHNKESGEVQLKIMQNGNEVVLSEETLRHIAVWFSSNTLPRKADKV